MSKQIMFVQKWLKSRSEGKKRLILCSKGYLSQSTFVSQPVIVDTVNELIYKCVSPGFKIVSSIFNFEIETESSKLIKTKCKIMESFNIYKTTS